MGHEKRRDYNDDEVEVEIVRGQEVHGDLSSGGVCWKRTPQFTFAQRPPAGRWGCPTGRPHAGTKQHCCCDFFSLSDRSADRPVGVSDRSDDRSAESYCNAVLRGFLAQEGF